MTSPSSATTSSANVQLSTPTYSSRYFERSRARLRRASWGSDAAPTLDDFADFSIATVNPTPQLLISDLIGLARTGYGMWDLVVKQLSGEATDEFEQSRGGRAR